MISLSVDLSNVLKMRTDLGPTLTKALDDAVGTLAIQSHSHLLENAQSKLKSTREKYVSALNFKKDAGEWTIQLDKSAMWIEEGMAEHEMIDDLLSSPKAKMSKDGSRFIIIPFQHNIGPSKQTQAQNDLTSTIKSELRRRNLPYGKLELGPDGTPKTGLVRRFDINAPMKTHEGPGQGWGAIGAPRQGPTGIPFLKNIAIYQKEIQNQVTGKSGIKKSIMTFRIASSKHKGTGRWVHPGLDARHFFEETQAWALQQWEQKIVPDILKRVDSAL